jgi:hypothetical protein
MTREFGIGEYTSLILFSDERPMKLTRDITKVEIQRSCLIELLNKLPRTIGICKQWLKSDN